MTRRVVGGARWARDGIVILALAVPRAGLAQQPPDSLALLKARAIETYDRGSRRDLEQVIPMLREVVRVARARGALADLAEAHGYLANAHNSLGQPDSAFANYRLALPAAAAAGNKSLEGDLVTLLGQAFHGRGSFDSAIVYYRRALPLVQSVHDSGAEGRVLNNIGIASNSLGRLDTAETYLTRSLALRRALGDRLGEGVTLNNLSSLQQRLGRPDSAIVLLRLSLLARRAVEDKAGEANTLNSLAYNFELLHRLDSALSYYRQSRIVEEPLGRMSLRGITRANMGRVFLELGELDSAQVYLAEGLAIKQQVGDKSGASWALNDLGRVSFARNAPDSALSHYGTALALLREVKDPQREGETLYNIAQLHHRQRQPDLARATAYYDSASMVRSTVGRTTTGDANRLSFAEQDVQLYENWSLAWLGRAPELGAESAAFGALAAAEQGRAIALLELIQSGTGIAPARAAENSGMPAAGRALTATARSATALVLSYLVTPDTLLLWMLPPSGIPRVFRQATTAAALGDSIASFRQSLGATGSDLVRGLETGEAAAAALPRWAERGAWLSNVLIPPEAASAIASATEVIVIPHGPTALVPFAALPLGVRALPLGSRAALRYAPSLATLREAESRPSHSVAELSAGSLALVVGNPTMPTVRMSRGESRTLEQLPGAAREGRKVAQRLSTSPLEAAAGSEAAVRRKLPNAPVVHLATHGFAFSSAAQTRSSFVALAPGEGHDGILSVAEILDDPDIRFVADLVVLSACQTGLGNLSQAEGTVGLQRALLAKGARSVLVSLWSVSDVATEVLMDSFYRHWIEDSDRPPKGEALRRAQADVRARPGFEHPRFWAAFQLVGAK